MTFHRSPLRGVLRSPLYNPLVGKWSGGAPVPGFLVTDASSLEAALAAASDGDWIQGNGFIYRGAITLPVNNLKLSGFGVYGSDLVSGLTQESAGTEQPGDLQAQPFNNLTGWTNTQTGVTAVLSTEQARSATQSLKVTGDGTDNRHTLYSDITALGASGERWAFGGIWVAPGQFQNNASNGMRWGIQATGTVIGVVEFRTNASGNINAISYIDFQSPNSMTKNVTFASSGVTWNHSAWNRIDIRMVNAAAGYLQVYINGALHLTTPTRDTTGAPWSNFNRMNFGNTSFGQGLINGGVMYLDDLRQSTVPVSAELQATDAHRWSKTGLSSFNPAQLIIDGSRFQKMATEAEVTSAYKWWTSGTKLVIYRPTDTATEPVIEASVRNFCIDLNGKHAPIIDDMTINYAGVDGIMGEDAENKPTITNSTFRQNFVRAYNLYGTTDREGGIIENNLVIGSGGSGGEVKGRFHGLRHRNNRYEDCCQLHEGLPGGHSNQEWSAGFKAWADAETDVWSDNLSEGNIYKNCKAQFSLGTQPFKRGVGIWLDDEHGTPGRPSAFEVHGDIAIGAQSNGFFMEKVEDVLVDDSVAIDCGDVDYTTTFKIEANNAPTENAARVTISHCTGYGAHNWAAALNADASGITLDDCLIIDSVFDGGAPESFYGANVNDTTHGLGNVVQYCNFGPNQTNFIRVNGTGYATLSAAQSARAWMTNNVAGDPLFINAENNDLRPGPGSPLLNAASDGSNIGASEPTLLKAMAA